MKKRTADAVIIGAGIIGTSIAYQLKRHGLKNVVILEKSHQLGTGSTGASSACLRQRYSLDELCLMAYESLEAFRNWQEYTGLSNTRANYVKTGVLWLMQESSTKLAADLVRMTNIGIKAELLNPSQVSELYPDISLCQETLDLSGEIDHSCRDGQEFLWEADGGYADPLGANQDLAEAFVKLGGEIIFNEPVRDVLVDSERVSGVKTLGGSKIDTPIVVNAAGPWCNDLNEKVAGQMHWTLRPARIQVCVRDRPESATGKFPMFGDSTTGMYGRPEAGGQQILAGSIRPEDEMDYIDDLENYNESCDPEFKEGRLHAIHHRFPGCRGRGNIRGYTGVYCVNTQDMHPIIGRTQTEGFIVANGFSGHGFKLGPTAGSIVAQIVTGQKIAMDTSADLNFLGPDRTPFKLDSMCVLA